MVAGICVALVLACVAIYGQTLSHDFVNYDDDVYVTDNPHVQAGLNLHSIGWAFVTEKALYFLPLTWMSLMLDHDLYGMHPGGYHFTNLILHAASSVLLFLVLKLLTGALWPSALVAALFAVHPLNVESVAWIAERKGVLSTFFWMLALGAYALYARRCGTGRYAAVAAAFVLGLMSKPMVVTLPFVLLLLDYWPLDRVESAAFPAVTARKTARLAAEKVPLFLITVLSCVSTVVMQMRGHNIDVAGRVSFAGRCANAMIVYVLYLEKAVWPSGLAVFYPYPDTRPVWLVAGAALILVAITLFCLYQARRRPYLIVGWCWYLGTMVPVIGFVGIGDFSRADRYTYIPLVGIFIMVAWGMADLAAVWHVPRRAVAVVSGTALVALTVCAGIQNGYWRDSGALFSHAIAVGQESAAAFNNLGQYAAEQGDYGNAKIHLHKALDRDPEYFNALGNLGTLALTQGHCDEAKVWLMKALELRPDNAGILANLGKLDLDQGRNDEARTYLAKALKSKPDDVGILNNLGTLAMNQGCHDEAKAYLTRVLALVPDDYLALGNLGLLAMQEGRNDEAKTLLAKLLELKPQDTATLNNLATLALQQKHDEEAMGYLEKALDLDPECVPALHNLGLCLMNREQYEKAQPYLRKVLEIDPQNISAMSNLAVALAKLGHQEESEEYAKRAAELARARVVGKE